MRARSCLAERAICACQGDCGRQACGDFMREGRTREDGDRRRRGKPRSRPRAAACHSLLDALGAKHERPSPSAALFEHGAHMLCRRHHEPGVTRSPTRRGPRSPGSLRSAEYWEGKAVLMARVDRFDDFVFERPEHCFAAAGRRDLRERGAPGAAADNAEPHAFTPAPRTFSAFSSSGQRARAGASRPSHQPAAKRSAPAQAIIAALSVHSQPGGTVKRRPCSRRRVRPVLARIACWPRLRQQRQVRVHRRFAAQARCGRRDSRRPPAGSLRQYPPA